LLSGDFGDKPFARKSRLREFASTRYSICACKPTGLSTYSERLDLLKNRMLIPSIDDVALGQEQAFGLH